jgi:hypothetical protein
VTPQHTVTLSLDPRSCWAFDCALDLESILFHTGHLPVSACPVSVAFRPVLTLVVPSVVAIGYAGLPILAHAPVRRKAHVERAIVAARPAAAAAAAGAPTTAKPAAAATEATEATETAEAAAL